MHTVFFALKRVHHGALRVGRRLLARTVMTPARFDLVHALAGLVRCWGKVARRQSDLWKALGVSRTTVSKMLRRMEELGLVQRSVDPRDRRQRWVELTREGAAAFRLARRLARAPVAEIVETLFPQCGYQWMAPPDALRVPDEDLVPPFRAALRSARRGLGDRAFLGYALLARPS